MDGNNFNNGYDPNAGYQAPAGDPNAAYGAPAGDPNAAYGAPAGDPNMAYGAPAGDPNMMYGAPQQPQSKGKAIAALVLGIVGLLLCCCYGIPAVICGIIAIILANSYKNDNNGQGSGMSKAGFVLGLIALILGVIYGVYDFYVIYRMNTDPSYQKQIMDVYRQMGLMN